MNLGFFVSLDHDLVSLCFGAELRQMPDSESVSFENGDWWCQTQKWKGRIRSVWWWGTQVMIAFVYRSNKKEGAYLYLARGKTLADIPDELRKLLEPCEQVMQLNLAKRDKLASEDIESVKANLADQGYHLQMPPKITSGVISYKE